VIDQILGAAVGDSDHDCLNVPTQDACRVALQDRHPRMLVVRNSGDQLLGSLARIVRPTHGPAGRHSRGTRLDHVVNVRKIDPANREPGKLNLRRDFTHEFKSRAFVELLGA
jgi:hypothetical protein